MLANRLKYLRQKTNLTQADLAMKIGVARTTYAMYEQAKREPDTDVLLKIADFFEVSLDYLLGRTDSVFSTSQKFDSLNEINHLIKKYGIEDSGFFDIEKWKAMGPNEIKELESYFEFITSKAKAKNNDIKKQ